MYKEHQVHEAIVNQATMELRQAAMKAAIREISQGILGVALFALFSHVFQWLLAPLFGVEEEEIDIWDHEQLNVSLNMLTAETHPALGKLQLRTLLVKNIKEVFPGQKQLRNAAAAGTKRQEQVHDILRKAFQRVQNMSFRDFAFIQKRLRQLPNDFLAGELSTEIAGLEQNLTQLYQLENRDEEENFSNECDKKQKHTIELCHALRDRLGEQDSNQRLCLYLTRFVAQLQGGTILYPFVSVVEEGEFGGQEEGKAGRHRSVRQALDKSKKFCDLVVNCISQLFATAFIHQDLGGAVREEEYVYGLTWEIPVDKSTQKKARVLLVKKCDLATLRYDDVGLIKVPYFKERWQHLAALKAVVEHKNNIEEDVKRKEKDEKELRKLQDTAKGGEGGYRSPPGGADEANNVTRTSTRTRALSHEDIGAVALSSQTECIVAGLVVGCLKLTTPA